MNTTSHTPSVTHPSRRGFTLIELLTVIAIIGILASIIIPTVGMVRKSAKETQSLSNLRQIALAINLYADENKDRFPPGYTLIQGRETLWTGVIQPYLGNKQSVYSAQASIFVSPLAEYMPGDSSANEGSIPSTYSAHGALMTSAENPPNNVVNLTRRSGVVRPTQVILVGEGTQRITGKHYANATFSIPSVFRGFGHGNNLTDLIPTDSDADGTNGAIRYRGRNSAPVAFVDGHVASMKKGTITYGNIITDR